MNNVSLYSVKTISRSSSRSLPLTNRFFLIHWTRASVLESDLRARAASLPGSSAAFRPSPRASRALLTFFSGSPSDRPWLRNQAPA